MEFENTHTKANLDTKTDFMEQLENFYELVDKQKYVMLTTKNPDGTLVSRPMQVYSRINGVDFYLFSNKESQKVEDIGKCAQVNLSLCRDSDYSWASVSGNACLVEDREKIKQLYNKNLKAWFDDKGDGIHNGGPEDPRLVLLKIDTQDIIYEIQKHAMAKGAEYVKSLVTGEKANMGNIRVIGKDQLDAARKLNTTKH